MKQLLLGLFVAVLCVTCIAVVYPNNVRKFRDIDVLLLSTGVSGTQIVYIATADDGTAWQRIGVGRWEQIPSLPRMDEK